MANFKVDNINIFYEIKGNPNGKNTIAFFNGVMASTSSWKHLYPVFEKLDFRIILHDFKGQLKSDKPNENYSFENHCNQAKALFDYLGVDNLHIVGTSYGGEVAMKFSILYPEITNTISIIDSVSELDPVLEGFVSSWKLLCDTNDGEKFFWGMTPSIYGEAFIKNNQEELIARGRAIKNNPNGYLEGQKLLYDNFINDVHMTEDLKNIKCPALIICGEDDILKKPKFSKIIADNIVNSEYILIPNCGHVAIFEKPKELESAILGFVLKHC